MGLLMASDRHDWLDEEMAESRAQGVFRATYGVGFTSRLYAPYLPNTLRIYRGMDG